VELLVVISILGLLAGLSIPAITKAQASARTSASVSNLKQIYALIQVYVAENRGFYPNAAWWGTGTNSSTWADEPIATPYWRRCVWNASYPSETYHDPKFINEDSAKGAYRKVMWCPLMTSKYKSTNMFEGHGSYSINKYFYRWEAPYQRSANSLSGLGKKEPLLFAGRPHRAEPFIGTGAFVESVNYPYDSFNEWYNLSYDYGGKALVMWLNGAVQLLEKSSATQLQQSIEDGSNFE
jgi:type II secretory pathway pseudopilin PulG